MFYPPDPSGYKDVAAGIRFKVLVHGENTLMAEFRLVAGSSLAEHSHPHEQTGYLVSGKIILHVEGREPFEAAAGAAWNIPGGLAHRAEVLEDAVALEIFYPVREDYLD